jgi:hypothetical protein
LFGDPDFCDLQVTSGSAFGLPSPGHTTLTKLGDGRYHVDSFFDITYRIDWSGCPGSPLDGLSGSSTGTARFEQVDQADPQLPCEADDDGQWSQPGAPIWIRTFAPHEFEVEPFMLGIDEGWMNPATGEYIMPGDHECWKYTFYLDPDEFIQQGSPETPIVYWLDVWAQPIEQGFFFGWKTSVTHWNDDAVWAMPPEPPMSPWLELRYPVQHPFYPASIDLAFALYGEAADTCAGQLPGDFNVNGSIEPADLLALVQHVTMGGPPSAVPSNGDVNGDCRVNYYDVDYLTNWFYVPGSPAPVDCTCLNPYGYCCHGVVGNANCSPSEIPTVSDISTIIDHLFITGNPLECYPEADANQSGGVYPTTVHITVSDISTIIDHLFITGTPLKTCYTAP